MQRDREPLRRRRHLLLQLAAACVIPALFTVRDGGTLFVIAVILVLVVALALLFASGALAWLGIKGLPWEAARLTGQAHSERLRQSAPCPRGAPGQDSHG